MRQTLVIVIMVVGSFLGLFLYSAALIDWVQDVKTGVYLKHHIEALIETAGILIYSYAGFKFLKWRTAS